MRDFPYQVIFAADEQDNVKIIVRWPDTAAKKDESHPISRMLNNISSGNWKSPTVDAVHAYGSENNQQATAVRILQEWGRLAKTEPNYPQFNDDLCMQPRNVFSRGRLADG